MSKNNTTRFVAVLVAVLLFVGAGAAMEANIQPSSPSDITLDSSNNYEVEKEFDGTASTGDITSYTWDLVGSGQSDTGPQAEFTFDRDSSGTNTIRLTVSNGTHSDVDEVTQVLHDEPQVTITGPSSLDEDEEGTWEIDDLQNEFDGPVSYTWEVDGSEEATGDDSFSHSASSDFTVTLIVEDNAGLTDSDTVSVNVDEEDDSDDSDDDSGSGSGSTGPAPSVPSDVFSELVGTVRAGDVATVEIEEDDEYGVRSISISVNTYTRDVRITVEKLDEEPADVTVDVTRNGERAVSHYMDIEAENLDDDRIDDSTIEFNVEQDWIDANDIDTETVRLERYHDGDWQELVTELVDGTGATWVFEAETPGFSYFAVTGASTEEEPDDEEEDVTAPDETDEEDEVEDADPVDETDDMDDAPAETVEEEESLLDRTGVFLLILLVIGLVAGGVVLYRRKEQARSMFRDLSGN